MEKDLEKLKDLTAKIAQWGHEKDLNDLQKQRLKLIEEAGELAQAILKNDMPGIADGIGDCYVVIIQKLRILNVQWDKIIEKCALIDKHEELDMFSTAHALELVVHGYTVTTSISSLLYIAQEYNLDFVKCVSDVYDLISKRTGKTQDGVFVKS